MRERKRVVVTGLGLVTPCGQGWRAYWNAVREGRSQIGPVTGFVENGVCPRFAGEIKDFDPGKFVKKRKSLKLMSREIQLAIAAGQLAIEDSGMVMDRVDADAFGVSIGTGIINNDLDEMGTGIRNSFDESGNFQMGKFGQVGLRSLFPLWLLKYLPNMPACHVSIAYGLKGPSNTLTTSAAAGAHAIGEAYRILERGDAVAMLAGGTDSKINAMGLSRFHLLNLLSPASQGPVPGYCPFDKKHDGIILGEGAGLIVLEELEHAKSRGANIYAEIAGYGSSSECNAYPCMSEDYVGKQKAMRDAVEDAGLCASDMDFVLANGSGIAAEDIVEAKAIRSFFGDALEKTRVTGVKPVTGHLVYGSAGVEIAAGIMAMKENLVPALLNLDEVDRDCRLPFVRNNAESLSINHFLLNSFGFGGQTASLVLKRYR